MCKSSLPCDNPLIIWSAHPRYSALRCGIGIWWLVDHLNGYSVLSSCLIYFCYCFVVIWLHHLIDFPACGFGTWPYIGWHQVWIWESKWWFNYVDWWGSVQSLMFIGFPHALTQVYKNVISFFCHNSRCILLIQVDIGLPILTVIAFKTVSSLKMLIRLLYVYHYLNLFAS